MVRTEKIIALTDYQSGHKGKVQKLRNSAMNTSLFLYSDFCDKEEADIEDLFEKLLYLKILKQSGDMEIDPEKVDDKKRIVKEVKLQIDRFSHYEPADWLLRNSAVLKEDNDEVNKTLDRFESIFQKINANQ